MATHHILLFFLVLKCKSETGKSNDGTLTPAFSLLIRKNGANREVLLVIRGSLELMDWSININDREKDKMQSFTYLKGDYCPSTEPEEVEGQVGVIV